MGQIAPKLFTVLRGGSIVKNIGFNFDGAPARSTSFLDRTVAARRSEKTFESTTEIIPGDRGKVGDSWCRPPLHGCASSNGRQISPAPLIRSRVRSVHPNQELSGERRLETARKPSQAHQDVSTCAPTQLPQRVLVATAQTRTQSRFPAGPPRQKAPLARTSRARKEDMTAGSERAWQSSSTSSIEAA